ncbi:P-loop containing nucleoside triphosphate hydrolase protein [Zopfia rhizophila CBS 207.26]|uniref:P-loop containing nucleoside triphosphate hydrolase protein n=1 Tax=Zopfia rhizophila CBS 207.26 TaxID=1314779 RepID=A0A6A6EBQ6_9PEZI|nr:P-loop containing nucleoside triphosphate hydrolase protein [Zopfia rhizophila CBS 207.26]
MAASMFLRQIWTLAWKDLLLILCRKRRTSTVLRAFTVPFVLATYMAFIIRVYLPKQTYGIGTPSSIRSLSDAISEASGNRNTLALCNYGSTGGDIDRVIDHVAAAATGNDGQVVEILHHPDELLSLCRSSLQGITKCFGAAEFYSSPSEGGIWNYSIRIDGSLGFNINVKKNNNDAEIFPIPLQHAIDSAIANVSADDGARPLAPNIKEYPFTSKTQKQYDDSTITDLQNVNTKYIAIVWYIGFIGLTYQLVGLMAMEREQGMADLLESMMPNVTRLEPQVARLLGRWIAFTIVYFPSWIAMAIIAKAGLFPNTSTGILIIFFILAGLALNSFSIFGAAFFKKAQLSGISVVVIALILGVGAQVSAKTISTSAVAILSILFTPMTFVYFMIFLSRHEHKQLAPNLVKAAPGATWRLPGLVFWIFLLTQIFVYPVLAALVERWLYQTASQGRKIAYDNNTQPVVLNNFTKHYYPNWFFQRVAPLLGIKRKVVSAVTDVSLAPMKGQIMVLVGANGCGKSTTLNAIAGLGDVTTGSITVNGSGGIGICPQKNMLWDHLTVEQHARIFYRIKSSTISPTSDGELSKLIYDCGLTHKIKAISENLSGGQKRKLQLIMMLTGGSSVCCVDEVSGGLDPLSRRKIWDILLAERGNRTVVLTTHFLDEAEFLADHMVIMSKGTLKAEGSVSELKSKLGGGYRIHLLHGTGYGELPNVDDLFIDASKECMYDQTVYTIPDTCHAMRIIKELESRRIAKYQVTGPTIEEVFMKLAEDPDAVLPSSSSQTSTDQDISSAPLKPQEKKTAMASACEPEEEPLMTGKALGFLQQSVILFRKRMVVLKRNYLPYAFAFLIPIIATALISIIIKDNHYPGCQPHQQTQEQDFQTLSDKGDYKPLLVVGPSRALANVNFTRFQGLLPKQFGDANSSEAALQEYIQVVDNLDDYHAYIEANFSKVTPGGFFLGDEPTFSFYSDWGFLGIYSSVFMQNAANMLLTNTTIVTSFRSFNYPWPEDATDQIQFILYFGLIMAFYPAFFALYPTVERLRKIRALEYSNGARPFPLWLAYLAFDWLNTFLAGVFIIIILAATTSNNWWNISYLFVVLILYGMASVLWSYMIALFAKSQLAAFALAAGSQGFMLLMYFTGIMNIQSRVDPTKVQDTRTIFNFTFNLVTPIGNLMRALMVGMNMFSALCQGSPQQMASYPGDIKLYGGPIVYLLGQSLVMFGILMLVDHGWVANWFRKPAPARSIEDQETRDKEVSDEIERVRDATDGLCLQHLTRSYKSRTYGNVTAVDDLTFGVKKGEVFGLVGPNGAGKSTTITMLRGDILPSRNGGSIHLGPIDVLKDRRAARSRLGVCPQFDAVDQMTVLEHLEFYAGVRGVSDAKRNARQIVKAVGLEQFADSMASKLSGGNKRKLSLGISLIGNPELVLLDEPSSGMDPLAKRTMWKTLAEFVPGRSVLLTTHSMEEADHLANRVGVLAKRMLDIGTTAHLRNKHGYGFHVQLICKSAPHSSNEEMEAVRRWLDERFPGAKQEGYFYHGQMRFNIPAYTLKTEKREASNDKTVPSSSEDAVTVGRLFVQLEENKEKLGLEFYSVSPSTFDEVFLRVVEKHNVGEEDRVSVRKDLKFYIEKLFNRKKAPSQTSGAGTQ